MCSNCFYIISQKKNFTSCFCVLLSPLQQSGSKNIVKKQFVLELFLHHQPKEELYFLFLCSFESSTTKWIKKYCKKKTICARIVFTQNCEYKQTHNRAQLNSLHAMLFWGKKIEFKGKNYKFNKKNY